MTEVNRKLNGRRIDALQRRIDAIVFSPENSRALGQEWIGNRIEIVEDQSYGDAGYLYVDVEIELRALTPGERIPGLTFDKTKSFPGYVINGYLLSDQVTTWGYDDEKGRHCVGHKMRLRRTRKG